jgi:hypothetical protein
MGAAPEIERSPIVVAPAAAEAARARAKTIAIVPDGMDEIRCLSAEEVAGLPAPATYPIRGFALPAGAVCVWGAVSWGGKTIALQDLLLAVATGQKVWREFAATAGRVVHVDMEQGDDGTVDRYRRLARARGVDFDALYRSGAIRISTRRASGIAGLLSAPGHAIAPGVEERYKRLLDGCAFGFIDTLAASTPDVEENDKTAGEAVYMLGRVAHATGATIIVSHHFTKASMGKDAPEHPQAWFRGHGSIFAAADYAFAMTGKQGEPRRVQKAKGRSMGDPLTPEFFLDFSAVHVDGYDAVKLNPGNLADPGGFAVTYLSKEAVDAERVDTASAALELRLEILEHVHRKAAVESIRFRSGSELARDMKRQKDAVLAALRDLRVSPAKITTSGSIDITEAGREFYAAKRGRPL